jgi:hypothetical protein
MNSDNGEGTCSSPRSVSPAGSGTKKKKSTSLPTETVDYLKAWMMSPEHIAHPYPTDAEKAKIMKETGIELKQLTNWFVNNRKRYWKPRVEARLREQAQLESSNNAALTSSPLLIKPRGGGSFSSKTVQLNNISLGDIVSTGVVPSTLEPLGASVRVVISEQSSFASESSISSDDESAVRTTKEPVVLQHSKTEMVNVHILRPTDGSQPSLSDVSTLSNVPAERILRTYQNCALTYRYSAELGSSVRVHSKKVQSRRDAEIVRLKKHYLSEYLAEVNPVQSLGATPVLVTPTRPKKRHGRFEGHHDQIVASPRPKFRRVSIDLWREACQTADHVYDRELPSLEEATQLFGYSSN